MHIFLGPHPRGFNLVDLEWDLRIYIFPVTPMLVEDHTLINTLLSNFNVHMILHVQLHVKSGV